MEQSHRKYAHQTPIPGITCNGEGTYHVGKNRENTLANR